MPRVASFLPALLLLGASALSMPSSASAAAVAAPSRRQLLHFSDVHLNISASLSAADSAAIPFAYFRDAPLSLLESSLAFARQVLPSPDFFLYTGDHVAHGLFSDEYIAAALEANVRTIEKFFPPTYASDASDDSSDSDGTPGVLETTAIIGNADGSALYLIEVVVAGGKTSR